jgi:hypothetical protein
MGECYFIRQRGDECSIVKVHGNGRREVLESGLTRIEAETLYFVCIGEIQHEPEQMTFDF